MRSEIAARAAAQADVVARWQLVADGMSRGAVAHYTRGLRELHRGVWKLGAAAPTVEQRRWAAVLSAPERYLSGASAGAAHGFRPWSGRFEVVTGRGTGGPRRIGALLICRSTVLDGFTTTLDGLPITTAARTLVDLAPHLDDRALARATREALRLRATTCAEIQATLLSLHARRRPARLAALAARYAPLPIAGTRSDAESHALALFAAAGRPVPRQNVRIAGELADLVWPERRHIVEIDGPDFHQFPDEDLRKQLLWEAAGWTVARVSSDDVYGRPQRLFDAAFRTVCTPEGCATS